MAKTVGLRTEILITLTLLLGAALLLGGIMMLRLMEKSLLEERVNQLDSLSQILAQSLAVKDSESLNRGRLSQLPESVNCKEWRIYDQNLSLVSSYSSGKKAFFTIAQRQQVKISKISKHIVSFPTGLIFYGESDAKAQFLVPLIDNNQFTGLLELHYSLNDIRANLLELQKMLIVYVLMYGIILVAAGYYLLKKNIISPAQRLLFATEKVSQGNLETRLPISGPLEISQLAIAYNRMVEALQLSREQTRVHIVELENKNNELQKVRKELIRSEKLASIGQLGAGLAHEIGNPLAALIGYLELLKTETGDTDPADIVKRSLVEAERINFLVSELLDFATPSESLEVLLDPSIVLIETVNLLKYQGTLKKVEFDLRLQSRLPQVRIGQQKLQQVFINLLLNAAQANSENMKICLSSGENKDQVWFSIKDHGPGITDDIMSHLFDPFFTTKSSGRGLGLSICHRIIEDAGGSISVQSELGRGSIFTIWLPAYN